MMMRIVAVLATLWVGSCFQAGTAWAFPEMVRHGYANCVSCHTSPTGGGLLSQYGRELSREVLSASGWEGSQGFAFGLTRTPEMIDLGGDIRSAYVYKDNAFATEGRAILMQADLEADVRYKQFQAVGTFGVQSPGGVPSTPSGTASVEVISRRHYLLFRPTSSTDSSEWSLRAGRFFPAYGINIPDHVVATKRGLGWDQGQESYNIEGAWIGEKGNLYISGIFGKPSSTALTNEKGASVAYSRMVVDSWKMGFSYLLATGEQGRRYVFGPNTILGMSSRLTLLAEVDFQSRSGSASGDSFGALTAQKLSYELSQGVWAYLSQEWSRLDFGREDSLKDSYGLGLQWFPIPHFEFNLSWQKARNRAQSQELGDLVWAVFHFYP